MNHIVSDNLSHELPHLWRFALRLSRSSSVAEELVQKTAVRALERRHQFIPNSTLRSWLYSIMHSIWKNELRAEAVRQQRTFNTSDIDDIGLEPCAGEGQQLFREVIHHVNQLPEAQRTALLLVCIEGYSYREAADIMDVAIGTVMSHIARARITIGDAFLDLELSPTRDRTEKVSPL